MKKYSFIINPAAGRFGSEQIIEKIESACRYKNISFEIHTTHYPGHATLITDKLIKEQGRTGYIISVGGDGTLNEIVNGFPSGQDKKDVIIGIVPIGSGNDFIKNLNYPKKINDVIDFILSDPCQVKASKPGIVEYKDNNSKMIQRSFINALGIGFDAYIAYLNQRNKTLPGMVSYLLVVLKSLKDMQFLKCNLKIDDRHINDEVILLTAGNGKCTGGGFYLTPKADPFKSVLDLTLVEKCRKNYIIRQLPKALFNKLEGIPEAKFFKFKELSVELNKPYYVHVDGEILSDSIKNLHIIQDENSINFITGN